MQLQKVIPIIPYLRCHAERALPNRFGEFRKTIPGISQKVLPDNLRSMAQDGIIIRTVYAEVPPRVEYKLSELGETKRPIISAMKTWGLGY